MEASLLFPRCRLASALFAASLMLAGAPSWTAGQLIPIRTVPVSQDHQFRIFPSSTASMAGITIAVVDSLLDPFTNPARGASLPRSYFFSSPATYSVSNEAGGGRTLPSGGFTRRGLWHAGVLLALQEVHLSERAPVPAFLATTLPTTQGPQLPQLPPEERSPGNEYALATLGREFPSAGLSLGASVFWSGLSGVDGVDLLYPGSAALRQRGQAVDFRLGMVKDWGPERSLEAILLHNRFGMTHDVWRLDSFWDPGTQALAQRSRLEQNLDHTNTWGLHVTYDRPLSDAGTRIGWLGTVNYKSHPKIPNYEIMNIPRDPGTSWAFDVGVGVAKKTETATFGLDFILEPIWSYTWADAAAPTTTMNGGVIPQGGRTIENWFRFSNSTLRFGAGEEVPLAAPGTAIGLQFGLESRRIAYRLEQRDNVRISRRELKEAWDEWTMTWGLGFRRPEWEIRYNGSLTEGTGRPGVAQSWGNCGRFDSCVGILTTASAGGSNILLAPSGPLTLDGVSVVTHQIMLVFGFR